MMPRKSGTFSLFPNFPDSHPLFFRSFLTFPTPVPSSFGFSLTFCRFVEGTNILVDRSRAVPYLLDIKDHIDVAFREVCRSGALAGEELTGVQFNLIDAKVHADSPHRGGAQVTPAARSCLYAAMLCARPRLVEPFFLAEVQTEGEVLGKVHQQFAVKRGYVFNEEQRPDTPLFKLEAYLPVLESFGFAASLRGATGGRAFPQLTFDHWKIIDSDPYNSSLATPLIMEIRERKGRTGPIPKVEDFNQKL